MLRPTPPEGRRRLRLVGVFLAVSLATALAVAVSLLAIDPAARAAALVLVAVLCAASILAALAYLDHQRSRRDAEAVRDYARAILRHLPTGVATVDPAGRFAMVNPRFVALTGVVEFDMGRAHREVLAANPELAHLVDDLLSGQEVHDRRVDFRAPDRDRVFLVDGTHMTGRGAVVHIKDTTDLAQMERQVRQADRLSGLGSLAAGVAHEVKNPLSALDIHIQLLEESMGKDGGDARVRRYLDVLRSEVHRLNGIVENFVRFARMTPVERREVDLVAVLERVAALVGPECQERGVAIVRDPMPTVPILVLGDGTQIEQVMLNLAINAVQAMPEGGTLRLGLAVADRDARISVADTGAGVLPEAIDRIFDLYYTTKPGGTGLGLPIAHKIVTEHGGRIDVESGPCGSLFTVVLPAAAEVLVHA